jgi:rhomboid protease GluP
MIKLFKKIHYNSPVILSFSFLSLFVLLLGKVSNSISTQLFFSVYKSSMLDFTFYLRLIGHVLGHMNYEHFFNNTIIILLLGPMLEEKYGSTKMLIMIVITAFVTGVLHVLLFGNTVLMGSSGVVFMLVLLSSFVNLKKNTVPLTLVLVIFVFLGKEIFDGLLVKDNISHITHIIGGLCGGAFGFRMSKSTIYDVQSLDPTPGVDAAN